MKTLVPSPPCRRDNSIVPLASAAQPNLTPTRIVKRTSKKTPPDTSNLDDYPSVTRRNLLFDYHEDPPHEG